MPNSAAAATERRTASAPRRCPAMRGRPCDFAQRPLPSMMMATCAGGGGKGEEAPLSMDSDLKDFLVLLGQQPVDLLDRLVGQGLDILVQLAVLVLGDLVVFFLLFQGVEAVAPHIAHGAARLLGVFRGDARQLLPPLLVQARLPAPPALPLLLRLHPPP